MITGLYANTNLDDGKDTRQTIINNMEENFKAAIENLYSPQEDVDLKDNPFFEAMNVPGSNIDWSVVEEGNPSIDLESDLPDKPIIRRRPASAPTPPPDPDLDIDQV